MKKITIFLFLLLSAVVGAQAQVIERIGAEVTALSELSADKRYVIQVTNFVSGNVGSEVNNSCSDFLYWNGSDKSRILKGTQEHLMQNQNYYFWTFTPQTDVKNGFKLSVNGGKFGSWNNTTSESGFNPATGNEAATYVLSSVEGGGFKMQGLLNNNPGNYLNYHDGNGVWIAIGAERAMTVRIFNVEYKASITGDPAPNKTFRIQTSKRGFWKTNNSGNAVNRTYNFNEASLYAFVQHEGKTYIYSVGEKKFLAGELASGVNNNNNTVRLLDVSSPLLAKVSFNASGNNDFPVKLLSEEGYCFNVPGADGTTASQDLVLNTWTASDGGNNLWISEAGDFSDTDLAEAIDVLTSELCEVVYECRYNNAVFDTKTVTVRKGQDYPSVPTYDFLRLTTSLPTETVSSDSKLTLDYEMTTLPFTLTSVENGQPVNPTWYMFHLPANTNGYCAMGLNGNGDSYTVMDFNSWFDDNVWFCITGDPANGFELYSKKQSEGAYLKLNSGNVPTTNIGEGINSAAKWLVHPSGESFVVEEKGVSSHFWNQLGGYGSANFGYYSGGSPIKFYDEITAANHIVAKNPVSKVDGYVGGRAQEVYDQMVSEAKNGMTVELRQLLNNVELPEVGKYYRIINAGRTTNGSRDMIGTKMDGTTLYAFCNESSNADVNKIWQLVPTDGGYAFYNVNSGKYLNKTATGAGSRTTMVDTPVKYNLTYQSDGKWIFRDPSCSWILQDEEKNDASDHHLNGWDSGDNARWYLTEATDIEIALNAVDGKSYSTVYLPFDVEATGNTNAYYAKEVGGTGTEKTITMTGTPGNKVKALQGALLVNDAAEAEAVLNIVTDAVAPEVNLLKGSCTAVTQEAGTVYVFGNGSDGVGFYRNNGNLKANRAYVDGAEGMMLVMKFDGQTTGIIDGVQTEGAGEAPLYDLSGRRVVKAGKGVYIRNGKKIYVK